MDIKNPQLLEDVPVLVFDARTKVIKIKNTTCNLPHIYIKPTKFSSVRLSLTSNFIAFMNGILSCWKRQLCILGSVSRDGSIFNKNADSNSL